MGKQIQDIRMKQGKHSRSVRVLFKVWELACLVCLRSKRNPVRDQDDMTTILREDSESDGKNNHNNVMSDKVVLQND